MNAFVGTAESWISLAIIRSLGKRGIKIDCASEMSDAMGFHSKYCSNRFHYPNPKVDEKVFVKTIADLLEKKEYKLPYFTNEKTLIRISKYRDLFEKHSHLPIPKHETMELATDKARTMEYAKSIGIPCPKTFYPTSTQDVEEMGNDMITPIVIKPRHSSNSKGIIYCTKKSDLVKKWCEVNKNFKNPILQEYIPPGGGSVGFEAIYNKDSELRAGFVHKRLREFPLTGGPSTLRISIKHPEVEQYGEQLLSALKWYGVAMVEFRIDPRTNKPVLMEINPRFWGSLALSIASGVDFPYLLYKIVKDGDITPIKTYKTGVKCRYLIPDIRHLKEVLIHGPGPTSNGRLKTLSSSLNFFEKNLHYDVQSLNDPKPGLFEIYEAIGRIIGRHEKI